MTATRSRATSSRPQSVARDTLRKRDNKPYKTEQTKVIGRKRKLDLNTTFAENAPPGFRFMPVGTPELAERCKELSRQRGFAVHVVNAQPVSTAAKDVNKVSHHINRVGYHFNAKVIDEACAELGYSLIGSRFVKETEIADHYQNSRIAKMMAKHGIRTHEPVRKETDDQIRAAVKELFPKIPAEDLDHIIHHAWAEGSDRIGTRTDIDLPRRVQLATIARIRHAYTDYDILLRSLGDWEYARKEVEPTCLQKIIEWRGENDQVDDNELEEIVRETIVIDDDEENGYDNSPDDGSDTSLEVTHRPAADSDFDAERNAQHLGNLRGRHPALLRNAQPTHGLREKIGHAREQIRNRNGVPLPSNQQPAVVRVIVPEATNGVIDINGRRFTMAPARIESPRVPVYQGLAQVSQNGAYMLHQHQPPPQSPQPFTPGFRPQTNAVNGLASHDQPVASIEPNDDLRRAAVAFPSAVNEHGNHANKSRALSPGSERSEKRRRIDYASPLVAMTQYRQPRSPAGSAQIQRVQQVNFLPSSVPSSSSSLYATPMLGPQYQERQYRTDSHIMAGPRPVLEDAQVAPVQYMMRPQPRVEGYEAQQRVYHAPQRQLQELSSYPATYRRSGPGLELQPVVMPQHRQPAPMFGVPSLQPAPVHGEPAAVQQIPRTNEHQVGQMYPPGTMPTYPGTVAPFAPDPHPQPYYPR